MPRDSGSRDFSIERYGTREEVIERLVRHYGLGRKNSDRAAHHSQVTSRWIHVEGTRRDFSVRCESGEWQIRIRHGVIPPRP